MTIHNFNAGPSILPQEVKKQCLENIQNFNQSGLSILEIGHRTKEFEHIVAAASALLLDLMNLSSTEYDVVFLQGGATTQFSQIPMNFLADNETAHYINTGVWSSKAIQAAKDFGSVNVFASGEEKGFLSIPKNIVMPTQGAYVHLTSNNTIYGTQWNEFPASTLPFVVDMSSDILSREMNYNHFDFIYAGAQKNIGIAGCTIVVIKKTFYKKINRKIPQMLQYRLHIDNQSMLNTPPVFAIYVAYLTLSWIKEQGGVKAIGEKNKTKAKMLYDTIDASTVFKGTVEKEDRSMMNACFVANSEILEQEFLSICKQKGIYGIKGHRLSGGFRASLYNGLSIESVAYLCALMNEFDSSKK